MVSDLQGTAAGEDPAAVLEARIAAGRAAVVDGQAGRAARLLRAALTVVDAAPGLEGERGRVLHHLCAAHVIGGNLPSADYYRTAAARAYGADHPCLSHLDADFAAGAALAKDYGRAAAILSPLRERFAVPCAAVTAWANLALSLAATRQRNEAASVARDAERLLADIVDPWALACIAAVARLNGDPVQRWRMLAKRARRAQALVPDAFALHLTRELLT